MPTWPTTKAGTTHVDAGSDKPGSARADIKQNIDNVNDMIDTIVVTSPSANQVLAYDNSDSRFENKDISTLVSSAVSAVATVRTSTTPITFPATTFTKVAGVSEETDSEGIVSISTGVITVSAGTYLIFIDCPQTPPTESSGNTYEMRLQDTTNTATLKTLQAKSGPDAEPWSDGFTTQTFSGSTNLEIQVRRGTTGSANEFVNFGVAFLKL